MTEPRCDPTGSEPYAGLARAAGPEAQVALARAAAAGRDPAEALLAAGVPKASLLEALSRHFGLETAEYDERLTISPELVADLTPADIEDFCWYPLGLTDDTVVVAADNPGDARTKAAVELHFPGRNIAWRVALRRDLRWFAKDFLHRAFGSQIGTARTGYAFWRNTMAHWRTKLACYRTDMAKARTSLNIMRWGLGLVTLSDTLMRTRPFGEDSVIYWLVLAAGLILALRCFWGYLRLRRPGLAPPSVQTLVEVSAATMQFLDDYHLPDDDHPGRLRPIGKPTMLGRLSDLLRSYSTLLDTTSSLQVRIHLARERNVLAAQRTTLACYRTIAARARTGLSLLRTGVTLSCLGLGLIKYFGLSPLTVFDGVLVLAGVLMIVDGTVWYWPVRHEQGVTPRCVEWGGDED